MTTPITGEPIVYLAFDVDALDAPPVITVMRPVGPSLILDYGARFWLPLNGKQALIATTVPDEERGHFRFTAGMGLVHHPRAAAQHLTAGFIRAQRMLLKLAASDVTAEAGRAARVGTVAYEGSGSFSVQFETI